MSCKLPNLAQDVQQELSRIILHIIRYEIWCKMYD